MTYQRLILVLFILVVVAFFKTGKKETKIDSLPRSYSKPKSIAQYDSEQRVAYQLALLEFEKQEQEKEKMKAVMTEGAILPNVSAPVSNTKLQLITSNKTGKIKNRSLVARKNGSRKIAAHKKGLKRKKS